MSNYENYRMLRNKVDAAIHKDKAAFQLQLVRSFRRNPKRFYGYVRRMQKVTTKEFMLPTIRRQQRNVGLKQQLKKP